jgi:hypothetical protein
MRKPRRERGARWTLKEENARWRGTLAIDFTGAHGGEYARLVVALKGAGWKHIETSSFVVESTCLAVIWQGIELVAKQASAVGLLSALTFTVQAGEHFDRSIPFKSSLDPQNAVARIRRLPYPEPKE